MTTVSLESAAACAIALSRESSPLVPLALERMLTQGQQSLDANRRAAQVSLVQELRQAQGDLVRTAQLVASPLARELSLDREVGRRVREGVLALQGSNLQEQFSHDIPNAVSSASSQLGTALRRETGSAALQLAQQVLSVANEAEAGQQVRRLLGRLGTDAAELAPEDLEPLAKALVDKGVSQLNETAQTATEFYARFSAFEPAGLQDLFQHLELDDVQAGTAMLQTALHVLGDPQAAAEVGKALAYVEGAVQVSRSIMALVGAASGAGPVMALVGMAGGLGGMGGFAGVGSLGGGGDAAAAQRHAEVMQAIRQLTDVVVEGFNRVNLRLDSLAQQLTALTRQVESLTQTVDATLLTARNIERLATKTLFAVEKTQLQVFRAQYEQDFVQWDTVVGLFLSSSPVPDALVLECLNDCRLLVSAAASERVLYPTDGEDHERVARWFRPKVALEEALTALPSLIDLTHRYEREQVASVPGEPHVPAMALHEPTVSAAVTRYVDLAHLARPQFDKLAPAVAAGGHLRALRQGLERCRAVQAYFRSDSSAAPSRNELLERLLALLGRRADAAAAAYRETLRTDCATYLREFTIASGPGVPPPNALDSVQTRAFLTDADPAKTGQYSLLQGGLGLQDYVAAAVRLFIGETAGQQSTGEHLTFKVTKLERLKSESVFRVPFNFERVDTTRLTIEVRMYGQRIDDITQDFVLSFHAADDRANSSDAGEYLAAVHSNYVSGGDEHVRQAVLNLCQSDKVRRTLFDLQLTRLLARPDRFGRRLGEAVRKEAKEASGTLQPAVRAVWQLVQVIQGVLRVAYGARFDRADVLHAHFASPLSPAQPDYLLDWCARALNGKLVGVDVEVTAWVAEFALQARELAAQGSADPLSFGLLHAQAQFDSLAATLAE